MDVDAEFDRLRASTLPPSYRKKSADPGLTIGIPILLDLFEKWKVNATFLIQEQVNEDFSVSLRYPETVKQINDFKHEIGLHTHVLSHFYPARNAEISCGYQRLVKKKIRPVSFRAGWHFTNENTIKVLECCEIKYDCSPWKNRCSGPMAWYDIPHSPYHPSYANICKTGEARLLIIPVTDYRLGISLEFSHKLMKKGTEVLIELSRAFEAPIYINLSLHSWDCINLHDGSTKMSLLQKLGSYLSFISTQDILKVCARDFGRIWEKGEFAPYYLKLPDLLENYLPSTSPKKYLWTQKWFLSKIPKVYYFLFKKILRGQLR